MIDIYSLAVKAAVEKKPDYFTGGFDIMKKLVNKQKKKKSILAPIETIPIKNAEDLKLIKDLNVLKDEARDILKLDSNNIKSEFINFKKDIDKEVKKIENICKNISESLELFKRIQKILNTEENESKKFKEILGLLDKILTEVKS